MDAVMGSGGRLKPGVKAFTTSTGGATLTGILTLGPAAIPSSILDL
jgi:hypothetical protein